MRTERLQDLRALRQMLDHAPDDALLAARWAGQSQPEVGRMLLARLGGLLDHADAQTLLTQTLLTPAPGGSPDPAFAASLAALPKPPQAPGEREVWVRGLAACLLTPEGAAPPELPLPGSAAPVLPPLGTLSGVWSGEQRWIVATERALSSAHLAGQRRVTLALSSWGAWLGARAVLSGRYGDAVGGLESPISVITLEDAVGLLSAAWPWTLTDLARLLGGPLLLDGVDSLEPAVLEAVTALAADTAEVFGLPALLMSAGPLTVPGWSELAGVERPAWPPAPAFPPPAALTLEALANTIRSEATATQPDSSAGFVQPTVDSTSGLDSAAQTPITQTPLLDTLVVLPSRGSAARLAALLPGSLLWSSSLCPVHLAELAQTVLARRGAGEHSVIVATTLPPASLGPFGTVWHTVAPLPYLAEAWTLCSGTFRRLRLSDVALPIQWMSALDMTQHLLDQTDPPAALEAYRQWVSSEGAAANTPDFGRLRADQDYAALASALQVRPATSRPALIPHDAQARALGEEALASGHLPTAALRYAAWLTPGEASRALHRGQARSLGWALLWDGLYDPHYGLAAALIEEARYARER